MKILISILSLSLLLLTGCSRPERLKTPSAENLRILSLVTAADHILVQLGAQDKLAAIDRHGRVLESMHSVPAAVAGSAISREVLRKYRINYAVIWYYQRHLEAVFRKENIPCMIVEPLNLAAYPELVRSLGTLCGKSVEAEKICEKFQRTFPEKTIDKNKLKKVYFELYTPWKSPGVNSYINDILQRAGGVSAAAGSFNGTVSPEVVAQSKAEAIFFVEGFTAAPDLAGRVALRNTPAVKNQRIYAVPRYLVCEGVAPEELLKFLSDKIKDL